MPQALTGRALGKGGVPGQLVLSREVLTGLAHCLRPAQARVTLTGEQAAAPVLIGYGGAAFLPERLRTAGRRAALRPGLRPSVGGLPPSPLQSRRSWCPYPATCGRRETQPGLWRRLGLREKDDWRAGGGRAKVKEEPEPGGGANARMRSALACGV